VEGTVNAWRVLETEDAVAFFDANPVCEYHTLVVPKSHCTDLLDASEAEARATIEVVKRVCELYRAKLGLQDFQVICSSGRAAQQDVFHLHFHVIPRHEGDGKDLTFSFAPEVRAAFDELLGKVGRP
jgi:histidine triad (HIT) family protein